MSGQFLHYQPEKNLWTEQDFDNMGWHDSLIYGIAFDKAYEIAFDIDYIFKWVEPVGDEVRYKFWVSPCTLVFENLHSLKLDIEITEPFEFEIDDVSREVSGAPKNAEYINRDLEYSWQIETHQGAISFNSVGFKQFVRQKPILLQQQTIPFEVRGGTSFERKGY